MKCANRRAVSPMRHGGGLIRSVAAPHHLKLRHRHFAPGYAENAFAAAIFVPLTPDHAANATLASAGLYPVRAAYQSTAFVDTEHSIAEIARHHIQPRSIAPATYRDRQLADKPMRRGRPPAVPGRCPR